MNCRSTTKRQVRRISAGLTLALLTGCAARPPARIEIPVPVPCRVELPPLPVFATEALPADAGIYEQVRALLAERRQRIAYELKLEAAALACAEPAPEARP